MAGSRELRNLHIDAKPTIIHGHVRDRGAQTYNYRGARYEVDGSAQSAASAAAQASTGLGRGVYRLEAIVGEKVIDDQTMYLAKWADYPVNAVTYEPSKNFSPEDIAAWKAESSDLNDIEMGVDIDDALAMDDEIFAAVMSSDATTEGTTTGDGTSATAETFQYV